MNSRFLVGCAALVGLVTLIRGVTAYYNAVSASNSETVDSAPPVDVVDSQLDTTVEETDQIDQAVERVGEVLLPYQIGDDGCVTKPYHGAFISPPDNCKYSSNVLHYCCPCGYSIIYTEPWCFNMTTGEAWGDEQPVPFLEVEAENLKPEEFADEFGPPCHLCLHFVEYPGQTVTSTSQIVTCDQMLDLVDGFNAVVDHRR
ncbi:MAG: hypothetical protein US42_C0006G0043 [Candidatus Magasanikbacteria bacterium GW2011_GWC2_37_14]|uniref:Uncharacterized protein n=1 Tax=Candidatus Magasanikbacteria bacterium GW2011_GWC2_37_14 TaxID=1619046 RepID=A0A0G0JI60_9BACT|nr:MAG: hypothetical protein US42_C0006G0043 [Candidatus Magasanikbacteria bacterium GW2011_GWC2_37_14]